MMENPILVERTRGDVVESFHRGSICIVDTSGEIIKQIGNSHQVSFTRSALKPFQALPLVTSGTMDALNLTLEEIAVACGSHNAEEEHLAAVNNILAKCRLHPTDLKCGPQTPTGRVPRKMLQETGQPPADIHNNCSGKHAGFLALCTNMGWSVDDYLAYDHPCQQMQRTICAEMFELNEEDLRLGEDGCSAPNYATTLYHQALGYKNLIAHSAKPTTLGKACAVVLQAMKEHPLLVAGRDRYCTELIQATRGAVIGKTGADGVFCMAIPENGLGIAIKIDDGKMGPQYLVAQAVLEAMGITIDPSNDLKKYSNPAIKNWNKHDVGVQRISRQLTDLLNV